MAEHYDLPDRLKQRLHRGALLDVVTRFYFESSDFNGICARDLWRRLLVPWEDLRPRLALLLEAGEISIAFLSHQDNPHVLRVEPLPVVAQLDLLEKEPADTFCIYPSPKTLALRDEVDGYRDRPFTLRLAQGEPQLTEVFFDLDVLERYFNDPRYVVRFKDSAGSISTGDGHFEACAERDIAFLDTFGIAYDANRSRVVVTFLRYLSRLSREQQLLWAARLLAGPCQSNSDYFGATVFGRWPEHHSAYYALLMEMAEINKLSKLIGKPRIFRKTFEQQGERPTEFHTLLRPTSKGFEEFIHLLDKMLSDNLNQKFFEGDIELENEIERDDGRIEVTRIGTLNLLAKWLDAKGDKVSEGIVGPLKAVRRLRNKPAHKVSSNAHVPGLVQRQDDVVRDVIYGLQKLRGILTSHLAARGRYQPPSWLDGDRIVFY